MSKTANLLLSVLLLGGAASAVGIGLTILSNWLRHGEPAISGDQVSRLVILGIVIGCMPLGIAWARSRSRRSS